MSRGAGSGFTLLELVVTIVIVAVGLVALLTQILQVTAHSADPMVRQQAHAIAQSYLEEILLRTFCDPDFDPDADPTTGCPTECTASACTGGACAGTGPLKEVSRDRYDDVCDYHGLTDDGAVDQNNNPVPELSAFNISVNVDDAAASLNGLSATAGEVVRVDVRVTHDQMRDVDITLSGYRANY